MVKLSERHKQRFQYLETLYYLAGGSSLRTVNHARIVVQAGLTRHDAKSAFNYLENEGLLQAKSPVGDISITHHGVEWYEAMVTRSKDQGAQSGPSTLGENTSYGNEEREESVRLFGTPAVRLPLNRREEGVATSTDTTTREILLQAKNPRRHVFMTVIQNLKRALANSLFDVGVRFLLSRLGRWR